MIHYAAHFLSFLEDKINFTLLRMLALYTLVATVAFPVTVTSASFYEIVGYAPPWDVLKPLIPPSTRGGGEYATKTDHAGSGTDYVEWTGFDVALSTVGLKSTHGALTLDPMVTAQSRDSISGTIHALPIDYGSYASMTYYFYVLSATSTVPTLLPDNSFHLDVAGNVNVDGNGQASATLDVGGFLSATRYVKGTGSDSFAFDRYLIVNTNQLYEVDMRTSVDVNGTTTGTNSAYASIDPVFTIAPQYQSQYQIVLSPNLAALAVPEPRTFWIFLFLLSGVAWNRWRDRRKRRVARSQV